MALLREQRNVVRALHEYYSRTSCDWAEDQKEEKVTALLGGIPENDVLSFLRLQPVFMEDKDTEVKMMDLKSKEFWDRGSRVAVLYRSCLDAKFIEPFRTKLRNDGQEYDFGVRITDRGTDLLNWLGFLSIAFEKHSKFITFLWGALAAFAVNAILWIITHLPKIAQILSEIRA